MGEHLKSLFWAAMIVSLFWLATFDYLLSGSDEVKVKPCRTPVVDVTWEVIHGVKCIMPSVDKREMG